MATKAELQELARHYRHYSDSAKSAIQAGNIALAIQNAIASFSSIDGMMQFERKYNKREFDSIETIELLLTYSPAIFDSESLDQLSELLKTKKRIDKNATADLGAKLKLARQQLNNSYQLWMHFIQFPKHNLEKAFANVGASKDWMMWLVQVWEMQGYVRRASDSSELFFQVIQSQEEIVSGKCPSCGVVGNGKKWRFWSANTCPKCKQQVIFVMIDKPQLGA